jgi:hypothetical protein
MPCTNGDTVEAERAADRAKAVITDPDARLVIRWMVPHCRNRRMVGESLDVLARRLTFWRFRAAGRLLVLTAGDRDLGE